jgi:hypothetical protein
MECTVIGSRPTFFAGMVTGIALAVLAPLAVAYVPVALSPAAASLMPSGSNGRFLTQQINRADKSDRLKVTIRTSKRDMSLTPEGATGKSATDKSATDEPRRSHIIPEGCDAAFSPLSRAASLNYASRCLS